jgi:Tol biopolymer transport system component
MRVVALAVTVVVAGAAAGADSYPVVARDQPLLLVESDRSGSDQLYAMSLDGSAIRRISHGRGEAGLHSVAPDGRRVVYFQDDATYIVEIGGTHRRRLSTGSFTDTGVWTNDASRYAYIDETDDSLLIVVDREGRRRALHRNVSGVPTWAPDGSALAFVVDEGRRRVERSDADGAQRRRFLQSMSSHFSTAAWSPDGARVAYASSRMGEESDLYVANADGTAPVRLTRAETAEFGPAWSPDGKSIAYVRTSDDEAEDEAQLWVMRADGTGARRLTRGANDGHPAWSPDGASIVFDRRPFPLNLNSRALFRIGSDGRGLRRLAPGMVAREPAWSPDGASLLATVERGKRTAIGLFDVAGRFIGLLTPLGDDSAPAVSADGKQIAFVRGEHIAVMLADGTGVRVATIGDERESDPRWAPDGLSFSASPRDGSSELDVVAFPSGRRITLARDASANASVAWSPRGDLIAYTTSDGARISPADGSAALTVRGDPYEVSWSPDGSLLALVELDRLIVADRKGRVVRTFRRQSIANWTWHPRSRQLVVSYPRLREVELVDVSTGRSRVLVGARKTGLGASDVVWSPDGSTVAFTRERMPGVGSDVFLASAPGRSLSHVRRVTRPFPDGGSNTMLAWLRGPRPEPARTPPGLRVVTPVAIARPHFVADVRGAGDRVVYVGAKRPASCGPVHVLTTGSLQPSRRVDPCRGRSPLIAASASARAVAWVLLHPDSGIGDADGACLYVAAAGTARSPPRRSTGCEPREPGPEPVASVFYGSLGPVEGAGNLLVVGGRGGLDLNQSVYHILRIDGRRVTSLRRGKTPLTLLGADSWRAVVLHDFRNLVVYRSDGEILRTLAFPRGSVLDAVVNGPRLVVLRENALEEYDLSTRARLTRLSIERGLGPAPRLHGAAGSTAAYSVGAVIHVVNFTDRRDVPLWIRRLAPPIEAALTSAGLYVGIHREQMQPAGLVGLVPTSQISG